MDSDESRPGSSASNSSSSSADSNENMENGSITSSRKSRSKSITSISLSISGSSSRNHSPESQSVQVTGPQSPLNDDIDDGRQSVQSTNDALRSISPDGEESHGQRSRSASRDSNRSDSSNNSSDGNVDNNGSVKNSRRNSNSSEQHQTISRNQSISPTRQTNSKSSRNSSVSSVASVEDEPLKTDDISDNELGNGMDLMQETPHSNTDQQKHDALNMSHEDLSDVSDLESAVASPANDNNNDEKNDDADDDDNNKETAAENDRSLKAPIVDLRQKLDERKNQQKSLDENPSKENDANRTNKKSPSIVDELNDIMDKKHDEDALDFEAEDGECADEKEEKLDQKETSAEKKDSDGEIADGDELEEGEVSDEDEKRPEETEPKPVCRFYTRGQCTWGMSCRFLHPGVTDKGNYTMFDMIRPVPISHTGPFGPGGAAPAYHDYRSERPPIHHPMHSFGAGSNVPPQARPPVAEPIVESAWERGLRTAKEMMRKANKRKEQDMDFEDKKMNLSASQDELEKDNYYIRERSPNVSPPPPFANRPPITVHHPNIGAYSPPPKYGPQRVVPPPPYEEDPYGRSIRYRELPPHRMPQYEDEIIAGKRRIRPAREVIVQRVEPVGRGDEWNDPWMRSKSPGRDREKRQRRDRRSYSSNSSYSSSSNSSSQSGSSSNSSRSPSPTKRRRRYSSTHNSGHKSPVRARHMKISPTPDIHKRRHSPVARRSPPISTKKHQITPPMPDKRTARSPLNNKRKRPSPPPPVPRKPISFSIAGNNLRKKKRSSSSGSGSSDSSASDSGSSYSSSSSGSSRNRRTATSNRNASRSRDKVVVERKNSSKKTDASTKKRSPAPPTGGKSSTDNNNPTNSSSKSNSSSFNSKKTTRREELLKQLRAVEDAIARKRSKLS